VIGLRTNPINWQLREFLEIGAALGFIFGVVLGAVALRRTQRRNAHVEGQIRLASGTFAELLEEHFRDWGLTPYWGKGPN
jgi:hypothetical protein